MTNLAIERPIAQRLERLPLPCTLVMPGGQRIGSPSAHIVLHAHDKRTLLHLATGQVGRVAEDYVDTCMAPP